jgi:hypothetical protein
MIFIYIALTSLKNIGLCEQQSLSAGFFSRFTIEHNGDFDAKKEERFIIF